MSLYCQELEAKPIPKPKLAIISTVKDNVEKDDYSMFEIMMVAMILSEYDYVSVEDYPIKVSLYGERQTFMDICTEALTLNNY